MKEYCVFVIPELWVRPVPLDLENVTLEEQDLIDEWQNEKDVIDDLVTAINGWEINGNHFDIVDLQKGVRLVKAGKFYTSMWFLLDRLLMDNPSGWFVSEMAKLSGPGLKFQGVYC